MNGIQSFSQNKKLVILNYVIPKMSSESCMIGFILDLQVLNSALAKWLLEFLGIPRNKGVNFHGKFGLGIPRNSQP